MKVAIVAATITAAIVVTAGGTAARAVDFSCTGTLNAAERTICSSASLRELDERMARLYGWLWEATPTWKREALRDDQRSFLAARNDCETGSRCLHRAYQARIFDLTNRLAQGPRRLVHPRG